MAASEIDLGQFNKANVDRLRATIKKKDNTGVLVPWAGIDGVVLKFKKPDRSTTFSRDMTLENDTAGIWYYDTVAGATPDLDVAGQWTVSVVVTDGAVVKTYPYEIGFNVVDEPE